MRRSADIVTALIAALAVVICGHAALSATRVHSAWLNFDSVLPFCSDDRASLLTAPVLLLLVAGSLTLAVARPQQTVTNHQSSMPTSAPPSPSNKASKSKPGQLRRRWTASPSNLATIVETRAVTHTATPAFARDVQREAAASIASPLSCLDSTLQSPRARSTLRVAEISVNKQQGDADGSSVTEPVPKSVGVPLNSISAPHAFENEFVRGQVLFMVDSTDNSVPEPPDVRAMFEGRRRLFWVQVQLQFKQTPSGIVYIGGEVPRPMSLGFFTRGMTKVILSVLQSLVPGLHYSFGASERDDNSDNSDRGSSSEAENGELPHICFPLYTAVDQFVATPPGQTPPKLGAEDFGETKEQSQQRRRSGRLLYPFNTRDTYSFHFHSFFIDFAHWQLVNVPGLGNTDLRVFWDNMPLRIVCYSLHDSSRVSSGAVRRMVGSDRSVARRASFSGTSSVASNAKKSVHSRAVKEYKFCLELSPQDPKAASESASNTGSGRSTTAFGTLRDAAVASDAQFVLKRLHEVHSELSHLEISVPAWFEYFCHTRTHSERRVGYVVAVRTFSGSSEGEDESEDDGQEEPMRPSPGPSISPHRRVTGEYVLLHTSLSAFAPLLCIGHELSGRSRRDGKDGAGGGGKRLGPLSGSISVRSRSFRCSKVDMERQFLEHQLQLLAAVEPGARSGVLPEQLCAAKTSLLELVQSRQSLSPLEVEWSFLSAQCAISSSDVFTRSNKDDASMPVDVVRANSLASSSGEGSIRPASPPRTGQRSCQSVQVLRVVSSSQWRNEWMMLHPAGHTLSFFRTQSTSCKLSIATDQVLSITMDSPAFSSCWCCSCRREESDMVVETLGGTALYWLHIGLVEKCHHVAFASAEEQEKWFDLLSSSVTAVSPGSPKLAVPVVPIVSCASPVPNLLLKQPIIQSASRLTLDSFAVDVCVGGGNSAGSNGKQRFAKRFVLNERCLVRLRGVCSCTRFESSGKEIDTAPDAGNLVRRCLRLAIKLQSIRLDNSSTVELVRFHDAVCGLRWADLTPLVRGTSSNTGGSFDAENERKAFFLNLFHLVMIHASVLGLLPKSKTKWSKFFNGVTYNIGGMYFSLAEIEHGILRASMSSLRLPIASFVIPRLGEPEADPRALLCLQQPDFRLNFAMNCMTRSCSSMIHVFDREHVDEQLNRATSETIARALLYDRASRVIQLPKMCDWYRDDFVGTASRHASAPANGVEPPPRVPTSSHAILGLLLRFVRGPEQKLLEYAWQHPLGFVEKYTFEKYDYRFQEALGEAPLLVSADTDDGLD